MSSIDRCPDCGRILLKRFSIHRCLSHGKAVSVRGRREIYHGTIEGKPEGDYVRVRLEGKVVRRFKSKNVFEVEQGGDR